MPNNLSRLLNYPMQSSMEDCMLKQLREYQKASLCALYGSLEYSLFSTVVPKEKMFANTDHMLVNDIGTRLGTYAGYDNAVSAAESMARQSPGRKFFVLKAVAVSVVETPAITKKL